MDCESFERVVMDLVYGELDESDQVAVDRHLGQCQRCRELVAGFRATRELCAVVVADVPPGLDGRILAAERLASRRLPLPGRVSRVLAKVAGYAMRPQLAMAALFLLMIGSGLTLLRPKPGSHPPTQVVEEGPVRNDQESLMVPVEPTALAGGDRQEARVALGHGPGALGAGAAPAAQAEATERAADVRSEVASLGEATGTSAEDELDLGRAKAEDQAYALAMDAFRSSQHLSAQQQFDAIVKSGGKNAAPAELYAALATEQADGCAAALPRFDSVSANSANTEIGNMATWHSATCRVQLGQQARATRDLQRLTLVASYERQARNALGALAVRDSKRAEAESKVAAEVAAAPPMTPAAVPGPVAARRPQASSKAKAAASKPSAGGPSRSSGGTRR